MSGFGIAGVQMSVAAFQDNVDRMHGYLRHIRARFPWVRMVLFSELAALGPRHEAEPLPGPTEQRLCALAHESGLWLIPGSLFEKAEGPAGDVVYNTCSVINPQGEVIRRFRKLFPFQPYERDVAGGSEFCVFDVPEVGRFGVSICYDMWFPETSRTLSVQGVEVLLHPTLTATMDRDVELAIAQATAACNQCFIFDINGLGDGGTGRSIVCGPDGRVLYLASTGPEMIPVEIDMERVQRSREHGLLRLGQPLKSFRERRVHFDIYDAGRELPYLKTLGPLIKPMRLEKLQQAHGAASDEPPPGGKPGA